MLNKSIVKVGPLNVTVLLVLAVLAFVFLVLPRLKGGGD